MYALIQPSSWEDAKRLLARLRCWVFRGQEEESWPLSTSLERASDQFSCPPGLRHIRERVLVHNFRRRAHHYLQSPPADDEHLEWLSIVQHHGGPTRLLDFTHSFYVASFFAIEKAKGHAAVWAINHFELENKFEMLSGQNLLNYKTVIEHESAKIRYAEQFLKEYVADDSVICVGPVRQSERLAVQKGVFLIPCNISKPFEENLCNTFGYHYDNLSMRNASILSVDEALNTQRDLKVVKIILSHGFHEEAYSDLYSMNIDAASLFPGLDGFARSLHAIFRA